MRYARLMRMAVDASALINAEYQTATGRFDVSGLNPRSQPRW